MKKYPLPVIIVAILFILTGCMGFVYHFRDLADVSISVYESAWVLFLRILAIVCGILLLYRIKWARWLAIAWMAYHVVIGAYNSTEQMITHLVFLAIVTILLFLPASSAYFNKPKKPH
jgi:hypothetical protein